MSAIFDVVSSVFEFFFGAAEAVGTVVEVLDGTKSPEDEAAFRKKADDIAADHIARDNPYHVTDRFETIDQSKTFAMNAPDMPRRD